MSSNVPALPAAHVPRIVPLLNPIVRGLMHLGVPLGPNVQLTVRGRKSGLPRTFPVALMTAGERLLLQSPYGEPNWVRNLRADPNATLIRGRRREEVEAVELAPEIAGPLFREAADPYLRRPLVSVFARVFIPLGREARPEEWVEHARRHPTFELRPRG
jgi:deazaflavin-dependent oxidoreductase (nitroreductase family)